MSTLFRTQKHQILKDQRRLRHEIISGSDFDAEEEKMASCSATADSFSFILFSELLQILLMYKNMCTRLKACFYSEYQQ